MNREEDKFDPLSSVLDIKTEMECDYVESAGDANNKATLSEKFEYVVLDSHTEEVNCKTEESHSVEYIKCDSDTDDVSAMEQDPLETITIHSCTECDFSGSTKLSLTRHIRKTHRNVSVTCSDCNFITTSSRGLLLHQRMKHSTPHASNLNEFPSFESEANLEEMDDIAEPTASIKLENSNTIEKVNADANEVDNLLQVSFSQLPLHMQLQIKSMGPHQPIDIEILKSDGAQNRVFSGKYFEKVEWLTISKSRQKLFCFYCLLFGGEVIWSTGGYDDIKNLSAKIKLHENTGVHINNAVKFKMLGVETSHVESKSTLSISDHNEKVHLNRRILSAIINCMNFCVTNDLPLPDPEEDDSNCIFNRNTFLSLIEYISDCNSALFDYASNPSTKHFTSVETQNKLLDYMYHIYKEDMIKDIEKANYVSLQVEKVPETTDKSQFVIILRYMKNGASTERIYSFIEPEHRSAQSLASALCKELGPLKLRVKLIGQSYDGSVTVRGPYGGVQQIMKEYFPHALFIQSYSHSFSTIFSEACSINWTLSIFFYHIEIFVNLFKSDTTRSLLEEECSKLPSRVENKWTSEFEAIKNIYHNKDAFSSCFQKIVDEPRWHYERVYRANQLLEVLEEEDFSFFIDFFYKVIQYIESLEKEFNNRVLCGDIMTSLKAFETAIIDLIETAPKPNNELNIKINTAVTEACGIIISELRERYESSDHLVAFSVADPSEFRKMIKFPTDHLQVLVCRYPMFQQSKLTSELKVLYNNEAFDGVKNIPALLNLIKTTELCETFSELCQLIELILATPISPVNSEMNVTDKLKCLMTSNLPPIRLNMLITMKIHKDIIDNILDFNNKVLEYFVKQEPDNEDLVYKN